MSTAVSYVCSPDRIDQALASARTVLHTSTAAVDDIVIFVVGQHAEPLTGEDPRIQARYVEPRFGDYFYGNKTYVCDLEHDRVIFLDADTFVLDSIDKLWLNSNADFLARPGSASYSPKWRADVWRETAKSLGCRHVPMYNAGVLVFQNRSHQIIKKMWMSLISQYLDRQLAYPFIAWRMPEQFAVSLAVARKKYKLKIKELDSTEHRYGWAESNPEGCVVFHTGVHYDDYVEQLSVT